MNQRVSGYRREVPVLERHADVGEATAVLVALGAVGLLVASYLMFVEIGWVESWDPVFGSGSTSAVLHSSFARSLPVPDAALGAAGYILEVVFAVLAARSPIAARLASVIVSGMALAAIGLVALQVFVIHHLCFLCLCSAALSLLIAAEALLEARTRQRSVLSWAAPIRAAGPKRRRGAACR